MTSSPSVAIVGCGAIAEAVYGPALTAVEDLRRGVWLVDADEDRAGALADRLGISPDRVTTDLDRALAAIDGAVVATPPATHRAVAQRCLAAGVAVLCEKPLAPNADDAAAMVAAAERAGRPLVVNHNRRLVPTLTRVREMIADGRFGPLHSIEYFLHERFSWPTVSGFYFDHRHNRRGVLLDRGAHVLDTVVWWLGGAPVLRDVRSDSFGGPEAVVEVTFDHGEVEGRIRLGILEDGPTGYRLRFRDAEVRGDEYDFTGVTIHRPSGTERERVETTRPTMDDLGMDVLDNFVAVLRGEAEPLVTGADVMPSARLLDQAYDRVERFDQPWYGSDPNLDGLATLGRSGS